MEGALEEGRDAPPEEEQAWTEEEDFSFVPMFAGKGYEVVEEETSREDALAPEDEVEPRPLYGTTVPVMGPPVPQPSLHSAVPPTRILQRPDMQGQVSVQELEGKLQRDLKIEGTHAPSPPMPSAILDRRAVQPTQAQVRAAPSTPGGTVWNQASTTPPASFQDVQHRQAKESNAQKTDPRAMTSQHRQRAGEGLRSRKCPNGRVRYRSRFMTEQETDQLVRIHWAATHQGLPYLEDHYAMSMEAKKKGGHIPGFAPNELPELPPQQRDGGQNTAFVELQGLGRVPFSNIRRPRPIMDIIHTSTEDEDGEQQIMRLEQEPLLAARIMIEDGMCLLLDVDDTARMLHELQEEGATEKQVKSLQQRQEMLMEGLGSSMHLASVPDLSSSNDLIGDKVFQRLLMLPKGRVLVSMHLRRTTPGTLLAQRIIWACLRCLDILYGDQQKLVAEAMQEVVGRQVLGHASDHIRKRQPSTELTQALAGSIARLDKLGCVAAMVALVAGRTSMEDIEGARMLPLRPSLVAQHGPLADGCSYVLCSLLSRATEVGLHRDPSEEEQPVHDGWRAIFDSYFALLRGHLEALQARYARVRSSAPEECEILKREIPVVLIKTVVPLATAAQQDQLRLILVRFD